MQPYSYSLFVITHDANKTQKIMLTADVLVVSRKVPKLIIKKRTLKTNSAAESPFRYFIVSQKSIAYLLLRVFLLAL